MDDDLRCCGSGTCLINAEGVCWCGQRWDGAQMCPPQPDVGELANSKPVEAPLPSQLPN